MVLNGPRRATAGRCRATSSVSGALEVGSARWDMPGLSRVGVLAGLDAGCRQVVAAGGPGGVVPTGVTWAVLVGGCVNQHGCEVRPRGEAITAMCVGDLRVEG